MGLDAAGKTTILYRLKLNQVCIFIVSNFPRKSQRYQRLDSMLKHCIMARINSQHGIWV